MSDLDALARDLLVATKAVPAETRRVVQRGALNIKRDWQEAWSGLSHAPSLASAVTYDTKETAAGGEAEIGPDKGRRQGALGNLIEFGSVNNGPIPGGGPALMAEAPRFEQAMFDLTADLL